MDKYGRLLGYLLVVSILLIIQAVLGRDLAIFASFPSGTTSFAGYMSASSVLSAHVILSFILVVADFMTFFMAIHARIGNGYIFAVMLSLISIVFAGVGGIMFLMAGQLEIYSYAMLGFLLLALACVGIAAYGTRKAKS